MKNHLSIHLMQQVLEIGDVSKLTQGAELGWFEYGRPGHDPEKIKYKNCTKEN